jgi:hypothetical protein
MRHIYANVQTITDLIDPPHKNDGFCRMANTYAGLAVKLHYIEHQQTR